MSAGAEVAQADVIDVKRQCTLCIPLGVIRRAVNVFKGNAVHEDSSLGNALHCGLRAPRSVGEIRVQFPPLRSVMRWGSVNQVPGGTWKQVDAPLAETIAAPQMKPYSPHSSSALFSVCVKSTRMIRCRRENFNNQTSHRA